MCMDGDRIEEIHSHHGVSVLRFASGESLRIPRAMRRRSPFHTGTRAEPGEVLDWVSAHARPFAMDRACYFLGASMRSVREMERRLREAAYPEESIRETLCVLEENGLLDDVQYSREVTASQLHRGYGPRSIRSRLASRGIGAELARASVGEVSQEMELDSAREALRKLSRGRDLSSFENLQKLRQALFRRGFDSSVISRVLEEAGDEQN